MYVLKVHGRMFGTSIHEKASTLFDLSTFRFTDTTEKVLIGLDVRNK
jgi:hypothetical protein